MHVNEGATLFKQVDYSLLKLIHDIDMGEIGLPELQRPFVWTSVKVRDLFDSMYRGFPVGYLLFWANGSGNGTRQIGTKSKQKTPRLLIVDGQQRLTSLYAVLKGSPIVRDDYSEEKISIAFRPTDRKFEVANPAIRKDSEWISDISILWDERSSINRFTKDFIKNLQKSRKIDDKEEDNLFEAIDRLYDIQNYPFTAMELSQTISEEQVSDVFVRINSKGVTLNQADFILTLMSVFWDEGRKELEDFCRKARSPPTKGASSFNYFIQPDPDALLRVSVGHGFKRARLKYVYSILRGKDLETEEFSDELREKQFEVLKRSQKCALDLTNWHEFMKSLMSAGFRSEKMITSNTTLIYSYTLFLIGKLDFDVDKNRLRHLIARWFFMASITGRYTSSPETQMEMDLSHLRKIKKANDFVQILERIINDELTDDFWNITLTNNLEASTASSPALFAYYAALNLLDANVLFSKMKVTELLDPAIRANKSSLETHHLFPKNYLAKHGITEKIDINQIANLALVEWSDNIDMSDDSPTKYLKKYYSKVNKEMQYWHALPEKWDKMEYKKFLSERRKLISRVIHDGYKSI